ncbi:MAG: type II toxin-antitoxin system YafQ family toxin [Bacteroidales bacterium]|nr:type II toxin-antitoxin system YafQ family toxin [Bacteroidales bacterium]
MWKLVYTTKFKKDLKRYQDNASKLAALKVVLGQLQQSGTVEAKHKPHQLTGDYSGCMECHIQNDFLLVWINEQEQTLSLVRLGSHSQAFEKLVGKTASFRILFPRQKRSANRITSRPNFYYRVRSGISYFLNRPPRMEVAAPRMPAPALFFWPPPVRVRMMSLRSTSPSPSRSWMMPDRPPITFGIRLVKTEPRAAPTPSFFRTLLLKRLPARAVTGLASAWVFPVSRFLMRSTPPGLVAVWVRLPSTEEERPPRTWFWMSDGIWTPPAADLTAWEIRSEIDAIILVLKG